MFDLNKTSDEKLFDAIIEKVPDNDKYYKEYREGTNAFHIRKDEEEKDELIQFIENLDRKINKSTNKSRISQLELIRKALQRYTSLGETFVDIDDEKPKSSNALLNIDIKRVAGEIENGKVTATTRE